MKIYSIVLVVLVAIEFSYIMYLETFATTSKTTARVFNLEQSELERKSVNTLFKNQGIYNGLLSLGLLYVTFFSSAFLDFKTFKKFSDTLALETEVWIADMPEHMIHLNGDMFLGPRG